MKYLSILFLFVGCTSLPTPTGVVTPTPTPVITPIVVVTSTPTPIVTAVPVVTPTPTVTQTPIVVVTPPPTANLVDPSCAGLTLYQWPQDAQGWTILPSLTQPGRRVIYVSAKNTVHNDGTNFWVQTSEQGLQLLRKGQPDSLLYNRGETFHLAASMSSQGLLGGNTPDLAKVLGSYGTGPRPIIMWNQRHSIVAVEGAPAKNLIITQLDIEPDPTLPIQGVGITMFPGGEVANNVNILIEDCKVNGFESDLNLENITNIQVRRNEILNACGLFRSQGIYFAANRGILVDGNFMNSNGLMNCADPTSGSGQAQNIYEQSDNKCFTEMNNVIANAHGNGTEARTGGVVKNNFFVANNTHLNFCTTLGASVEGKIMSRYCGGLVTGNAFIDGGIGMTLAAIGAPTQVANNVMGQHATHSMFIAIDSQNGPGVHGLTIKNNNIFGPKYYASYQGGLPVGPVKMFNDGSQGKWTDCDSVFGNKPGLTTGMAGLPVGQTIWTPAPQPWPSPTKDCNPLAVGFSVNGADVWTVGPPSVKVIDSVNTGIFMEPSEAPVYYNLPNSFVGNNVSTTNGPFEVSQTIWKTNPATAMPEIGDNLNATFVNSAWEPPANLYTAMAAQAHDSWNSAITAQTLLTQAHAAYTPIKQGFRHKKRSKKTVK